MRAQMYRTAEGNRVHRGISRNDLSKLKLENIKRMQFIQNEVEKMGREYDRCLEMDKFYRDRLCYVG